MKVYRFHHEAGFCMAFFICVGECKCNGGNPAKMLIQERGREYH